MSAVQGFQAKLRFRKRNTRHLLRNVQNTANHWEINTLRVGRYLVPTTWPKVDSVYEKYLGRNDIWVSCKKQ